jgi:hypothetical protein
MFPEEASMRHRVATPGLLIIVLYSEAFLFAQNRPKDLYRKGEQHLKLGHIYDAVDELTAAARLEPRNKKYQRKLAGASKEASNRGEADSSVLRSAPFSQLMRSRPSADAGAKDKSDRDPNLVYRR